MQHYARFLCAWRVGLLCLALAACDSGGSWHSVDVEHRLPPLRFALSRASDGRAVTASDYRGKVALVYFGYAGCSDACPTTLADLGYVLKRLGDKADQVRVLFVTVDPGRDSLSALKRYTALFAPQVVGLRGSDDQLAAMVRRYRAAYSTKAVAGGLSYEVSHSTSVYVFDQTGAARLLIPALDVSHDIEGTAADLRRIIGEAPPSAQWRHSQIPRPSASG